MAWKYEDVLGLAREIRNHMPVSLLELLQMEAYDGGALVQLESDTARPNAQEIALNFPFIKPVVARFPASVPSGFYLTDVFLLLDRLFLGRILQVKGALDTKQGLASAEASRVKRLIGGLRYLWRSSNLSSRFFCNLLQLHCMCVCLAHVCDNCLCQARLERTVRGLQSSKACSRVLQPGRGSQTKSPSPSRSGCIQVDCHAERGLAD